MSLEVLRSLDELEAARRILRSRGLGPSRFPDGYRRGISYMLRTRSRLPPPEWKKAWDLEKTIRLVEGHVSKGSVVLDLGAFNSALIPALARLGYSNIIGVDLDPRIRYGPRRDVVRYLVADFHQTGLADGGCGVVTAMSTIEHGWQGDRLLSEVSRLLAPGGLFIASTDYWPSKIDTSTITAFGLPWIIFSEEELRDLIAGAAAYGLRPTGMLDFRASEPVIDWMGRSYTFAHFALQRI